MGISCKMCKSKCCNNITKSLHPSSNTPDIYLNNLTATKLDEKIKEDPSIKCSYTPFSLSSLDVLSTPIKMNTVSPLSATEMEGNYSVELLESEIGKSEMMNQLKKDIEPSLPKTSYSTGRDLDNYEATRMDITIVDVIDDDIYIYIYLQQR